MRAAARRLLIHLAPERLARPEACIEPVINYARRAGRAPQYPPHHLAQARRRTGHRHGQIEQMQVQARRQNLPVQARRRQKMHTVTRAAHFAVDGARKGKAPVRQLRVRRIKHVPYIHAARLRVAAFINTKPQASAVAPHKLCCLAGPDTRRRMPARAVLLPASRGDKPDPVARLEPGKGAASLRFKPRPERMEFIKPGPDCPRQQIGFRARPGQRDLVGLAIRQVFHRHRRRRAAQRAAAMDYIGLAEHFDPARIARRHQAQSLGALRRAPVHIFKPRRTHPGFHGAQHRPCLQRHLQPAVHQRNQLGAACLDIRQQFSGLPAAKTPGIVQHHYRARIKLQPPGRAGPA